MSDLTFAEVMKLTSTISSHTAFEEAEGEKYFELLMSLPARSNIVEIGLQFGRSSSIALQVAKVHKLIYWGVDPFKNPPDSREAWFRMVKKIDMPDYNVLVDMSQMASAWLPARTHLALIDGDHYADGVRHDIEMMAPLIVPGGYLLFHDYGHESLPDVYPTVNAYMVQEAMDGTQWEEEPTVGCLGVWRKKGG